jgi:periplasmic protein TonB
MPSTVSTGGDTGRTEDRRSHPRGRCEQLAYVRCGPDNGGILLDVSEGGLRFQGVGTITGGETLRLAFLLPGTSSAIEATGRLVWTNDSQKGGGLQFVTLDAKAQERIRQWLAGSGREANSKVPVVIHGIPESPAAPAAEASHAPAEINEAINVAAPAVLGAESAHQASEDIRASVDMRASEDMRGPEDVRAPGDVGVPGDAPANVSARVAANDRKPTVARTPFLDGQRRSAAAAPAPPAPQHSPTTPPQLAPRGPVAPPAVRPAEPEPRRRIVLTGMSERRSRTIPYALGGALGCVVVLVATITFFRSHGAIRGVLAGQPSVPPLGQSALGTPEGFRVEVIDLNNKRWTLSNDSQPAPVPSQAFTPAKLGVAPAAAVVSTPVAAAPAAAAPAVATPQKRGVQLALSSPRVVNPQSANDRQVLPFTDSLLPSSPPIDARSLAMGTPNVPAPPPPPLPIVAPVRPQLGLQEAVPTKRVDPLYPAVARQLHIEGIVQVQAAIDTDGLPHEVKLVSGDPRLTAAALNAVRQWRFKPAQLDGQAVETSIVIKVEFRLGGN